MKVIAVTGTIASGKSTISKLLNERYNSYLFDCDKICEQIIAKENFEKIFGFALNIVDLKIKKEFISDYIFQNSKKKSQYEKYMWDLCKKEFDKACKKYVAKKYIVLDAPLFFQAGMEKSADYIVFIDAKEQDRKDKYIVRGGNEKDFCIRNKIQQDYFENNKNYIEKIISVKIINNFNTEELRNILEQKLFNSLLKE